MLSTIPPSSALLLLVGLAVVVAPGCSAGKGKFTAWNCTKVMFRRDSNHNVYWKTWGCDKTDGDGDFKRRSLSLGGSTDAGADSSHGGGEADYTGEHPGGGGEHEHGESHSIHHGVNAEGHIDNHGHVVIDRIDFTDPELLQTAAAAAASSSSEPGGRACKQDRHNDDRALVIGLAVALAVAVVLIVALLCAPAAFERHSRAPARVGPAHDAPPAEASSGDIASTAAEKGSRAPPERPAIYTGGSCC